MENFTPFTSVAGGVLIGLSAVILMLLNGRIAGVSGITAGLLSLSGSNVDRGWRLVFVVGIVAAPMLLSFIGIHPAITFVASQPVTLFAGFLVGFGTVIGNGCTSGHGVCGIARLSSRSLVATAAFMIAGIVTTFIVRHVIAGG